METTSPPKSLPKTELADSSKSGLFKALEETRPLLRAASETLDADTFFQRPSAETWSAAEHVVHLIKSVRAVANGLAYAKWLVRLRFGKARDGSRSYDELVAYYQSKLSRGARASGRYVPEVETPDNAAAARQEMLDKWDRSCDRLTRNLETWNEQQLDTLRFPHPLLGKLTVREMLFFTRYHNLHHIQRIEEADPSGAPS